MAPKKQKNSPVSKDNIDEQIAIEQYEENLEERELIHTKQSKDKELDETLMLKPSDKETSETTGSDKDRVNDFSVDKKLKAERLSHMITQAVEKELLKVETTNNNYTVDYCRTTNALRSLSELIDKQTQLNNEQKRVESEMKKIMSDVSKDIVNHDVLNEHLKWSHILDISKKGRGISIQYNDGSRDYFAKLNEYASLKAIEIKKYPEENTYVLNKEVMDKITRAYIKREDGGQLMDNIETIINNHKHKPELFDEDFFEDFFNE